MSNKDGTGRTRNFQCIVYPPGQISGKSVSHTPDNWIEILRETHVPTLISPLHDKDKNPDGESKIPHYHVICMFDSVKSDKQWVEFCQLFAGVPDPHPIYSLSGATRYLCHLDNPEKYQYSTDEIIALSSADYIEACNRNQDVMKVQKEMQKFIAENEFTNFAEFCDYVLEYRLDWYYILTTKSVNFIKTYIKENRSRIYTTRVKMKR